MLELTYYYFHYIGLITLLLFKHLFLLYAPRYTLEVMTELLKRAEPPMGCQAPAEEMRAVIILWDFIPDPLTSIQAHPSPTCPVQPPFAATLTSVLCLLSGISILRDHPGMQQQQQQKRHWQHSFEPVFWAKSPQKAAERGRQ